MKDSVTLAYINMYAIFGTLENLCDLVPEAQEILTNPKPLSIGFSVHGGPQATLTFSEGKCRLSEGTAACDIKLPFSSCEKFNGMIDGTVTPFPSKGLTKINFLLKNFTKLTDLLSRYLRATPEDCKDPVFYETSTKLMFYTITSAISQIGNHDKIGSFSASNLVDGTVQLSIKDGPAAGIVVSQHTLHTEKLLPEAPRAIMEFRDWKLARQLFDGQVNAVACIGDGSIRMRGMISMVDNINRILDRVSDYLA